MTTLSRIIGILLLAFITLLTSCSSDDDNISTLPEPDEAMTSAALTTYFTTLAEDSEIPGFAVSIVKDGAIVYQNAVGYANIENEVAYTNHTVNFVASLSKTFVGAATAKAISDGHFTLDTNINELLPVPITNPKQPNAVITVKHLVTHTSGLIDNVESYLAHNYYILLGENTSTTGANILKDATGLEQRAGASLEDFLANYFLEDGDLYSTTNFANVKPGEVWNYSNTGTALMGYIIESVTEQSFDDYVKQTILAPLQMNASTFNIDEVNMNATATCYLEEGIPLPKYAFDSYPEGGLYTNNEDMGNYLLEMSNGLSGDATTLFNTSSYNMLFNYQLADGIVPGNFADNHGLFWYSHNSHWAHGGNDPGVSTYIELAEDGSWGYSMLSNMDAVFGSNESKYLQVKEKIEAGVQAYLGSN